MTKFNLQKYRRPNSKIYSGRDNGIAARKELKLNDFDKNDLSALVIFPKDTWAINSSFFGGLFETSVMSLREEKFRKKYRFQFDNGDELSPELLDNINQGIFDALNEI